MTQPATKIAVLGAGSWGTALAQLYAQAGWAVSLWCRDAAQAEVMQRSRRHPRFFPDLTLADGVRITADLAAAVELASDVVLVVPAKVCVALAARLQAAGLPTDAMVINAAKGFAPMPDGAGDSGDSNNSIHHPSGLLLPALAAVLPAGQPLAVLSGPNFAGEVVHGLPAAATLACADATLGMAAVERLSLPSYRLYHNSDVVGVQVGGALKNVIALAAGMTMGHGLGENARAALITRGLAEMARLAEAMGGQRTTLMGLSGLGDLLLTATSEQSRNYRLGLKLGRAGQSLAELAAATVTDVTNAASAQETVEGVGSAALLADLCQRYGVELPLAGAVQQLLTGQIPLAAVAQQLLTRPYRAEG
jgi:glycerol-3-phosphate dehydrogenase (NAD(P)+)